MIELGKPLAAAAGALLLCGAAQAAPFSLTSSSFKDSNAASAEDGGQQQIQSELCW